VDHLTITWVLEKLQKGKYHTVRGEKKRVLLAYRTLVEGARRRKSMYDPTN